MGPQRRSPSSSSRTRCAHGCRHWTGLRVSCASGICRGTRSSCATHRQHRPTTCAGVRASTSVPFAAISALVLRIVPSGGDIFLLMSTLLATYIVAAFVTGPDWGAAAHGLLVPACLRPKPVSSRLRRPSELAPWGLAFIQSYAADKKLTVADLRSERIDVVTGAVMSGESASSSSSPARTRSTNGGRHRDATDAASALEPLAGRFASVLFGAGLLGASILAASIFSRNGVLGQRGVRAGGFARRSNHDAPVFWDVCGSHRCRRCVVLIPQAPLVPILYLSQALNAILLLPILVFVVGITRDRTLMGGTRERSRRDGTRRPRDRAPRTLCRRARGAFRVVSAGDVARLAPQLLLQG